MLKQLRPQRVRDADELVPELRELRHRRRLVLVDPQVVREGVAVMVRHLVSIKIDLEAKTVFCFGTVDAARCRAALLHVARVLNTFALLRPVVALGVLVRAARLGRGGEREREERGRPHRSRVDFAFVSGFACLFSLRRRARQPFALVEHRGGVRATSVIFSGIFFGAGSHQAVAVRQAQESARAVRATNEQPETTYKNRNTRI